VIALSLGVYAVKNGIFAIVSGGSYNVHGPDPSFLATNNAIGLAFVMNLPLLTYLLKMETHLWLRRVMKVMIFLTYPAVICTYSRGAWLGLASVTAVMALKSRRKFLLIPCAVVALFIVTAVPDLVPQRVEDRYEDLVNYKSEVSAESRFWNWEFCKRVGMANPLTGAGFSFSAKELYAIYYPEFIERWGPDKEWSCHSVWFTILAENGVVGLTLWLWLLGASIMTLRQMRSFGLGHTQVLWISDLTYSLNASLIGFMVVGTFFDAAYFDMFYYLIAIVISMKELLKGLEVKEVGVVVVENQSQKGWEERIRGGAQW
jgi:probable O-glycosylation ligase (exosortase A-associated)